MEALSTPLQVALLILVVIVIFNIIIFVHELGHFWAAKWRGLRIDRFQIWFGKPIWSRTVNGVQYGLGWIPAGGFVALPQMAPMEAIEGGNLDREPLPPIKPIDKIIVAFAGPLFSFLLAFAAAVGAWAWGKPADIIPTTVVGSVWSDETAAGKLFRGDRILAVNGHPVDCWDGTLDSVFMQVVTSQGDEIEFTIDRPGQGEMKVSTSFKIGESKWYQRRGLRDVGIEAMGKEVTINEVSGVNGPAKLAGLQKGDKVIEISGRPILHSVDAFEALRAAGSEPIEFTYERDGERATVTVTPRIPVSPKQDEPRAMIGVSFSDNLDVNTAIVHIAPLQQMKDTVRMMWTTIASVASPRSSIGIDQLSGPIGIAKIKFMMLLMDHPWQRILGFMVLLNVNLAILNMLPFPVLDGGHITLATLEAVAGRPVRAKVLEFMQVGFAMLLFSLMLYVTSKDIFDGFGRGGKSKEYVFPAQ